MDKYIQDSLSLRIDGEHIPSVIPTTDQPKPRAAKRRLQDARSHGMPDTKRCRACNIVKPASEFTLHSSSRDGLWFRCAECNRKAMRERYHAATPEQVRARRLRNIQYTYGITPEKYEEMFDAQGRVCAICKSDNHKSKDWHVDHDHSTGQVRGILCNGCNSTLGGARDSPDILRAAILYLEKNGK